MFSYLYAWTNNLHSEASTWRIRKVVGVGEL